MSGYNNYFSQLKNKVDIIEFLTSATGTRPTRRGGIYKMLCPFHTEKTPSFTIYPDQHSYHCFGCGTHGDIFNFIMNRDNIDFTKAAEQIVKKYDSANFARFSARTSESNGSTNERFTLKHEPVPYDLLAEDSPKLMDLLTTTQQYFREQLVENSSLLAKKARAYIAKRNLECVVEPMGIGFAPNNDIVLLHLIQSYADSDPSIVFDQARRTGLITTDGVFRGRITFPLRLGDGQITGFTARTLADESNGSKYKNSPDSQLFSKRVQLFGLEYLSGEDVQKYGLFLVEGILDLAPFIKQDLHCALAIGSTGMTEYHVGILQELRPPYIHIVTDGDDPGVMGAISIANRLVNCASYVTKNSTADAIRVTKLPEGKDPFDVFYTDGKDVLGYVSDHSSTPQTFFERNYHAVFRSLKTDANALGFIRNHTRHVIPLKKLKKLGISIDDQVDNQYSCSGPPPIILGKVRSR